MKEDRVAFMGNENSITKVLTYDNDRTLSYQGPPLEFVLMIETKRRISSGVRCRSSISRNAIYKMFYIHLESEVLDGRLCNLTSKFSTTQFALMVCPMNLSRDMGALT
jgi:hypothetical protein